MKPFEEIKLHINKELHDLLPKKWKKIGSILVADFSQINNTGNFLRAAKLIDS